MIAVDTNVLVRLLTGDDPKQEAAARSLFADKSLLVFHACRGGEWKALLHRETNVIGDFSGIAPVSPSLNELATLTTLTK
jgi:hypothetical protein